jgi:hypothetical protein
MEHSLPPATEDGASRFETQGLDRFSLAPLARNTMPVADSAHDHNKRTRFRHAYRVEAMLVERIIEAYDAEKRREKNIQ